jgi:cyclin H
MTHEVLIPSAPAYPMSGNPELTYLQTSQARNWRFSAKQMEKMRRQGSETAQQRLRDIWVKERSLQPVDGEPEASSSSSPLALLSVEEEQTLIAYYLSRVRQLVKAFSLPEVVEATTITFIKRFYLRNTCMDYHPKNIMLTCLFLAAKVESNAVPLKHFAQKLAGKDPTPAAVAEYSKIVQDLEFLVSQSLSFEYTVHGAHRALHGLFLDLQSLQPKPNMDSLSTMLAPSRANLQRSRFTDVELIFTPAQIALACVYSIDDAAKDLIGRYVKEKEKRADKAQDERQKARNDWRHSEKLRLERKGVKQADVSAGGRDDESIDLSREPLGSSSAEVTDVLQTICAMIDSQSLRATDSLDSVREIDKKLKICQNPQLIANSRMVKYAELVRTEGGGSSTLGKRNVAGMEVDDEDDDDDGLPIDATSGKRAKVE